jgi:hypothetical protein
VRRVAAAAERDGAGDGRHDPKHEARLMRKRSSRRRCGQREPTAREIAAATKGIRARWGETTEVSRQRYPAVPADTPEIPIALNLRREIGE